MIDTVAPEVEGKELPLILTTGLVNKTKGGANPHTTPTRWPGTTEGTGEKQTSLTISARNVFSPTQLLFFIFFTTNTHSYLLFTLI